MTTPARNKCRKRFLQLGIKSHSNWHALTESVPTPRASTNIAFLYGSEKPLCVLNRVYLTSKDLASARATTLIHDRSGVELVFNQQGAQRIQTLTRENLDRRVVMVLDGKILSAPIIRAEITSGQVQISGMDSQEATEKLVARIQQVITSSGN
jgi:preprotein translocase subunit SecD